MPILIEEPIVLAESQDKIFKSVTISKNSEGKLQAAVVFDVLCPESGAKLKEDVLVYEDEAYNTFWSNFNTGTYLYQELTKDIEGLELPENLEEDFLN